MTVTVIMGGTQGLGEAVARELAARDGTTGLVIAGRSVARGEKLAAELTAAGTPTLFVDADVSDPAAVRSVFARADERFGVVHGLVNVAACTDRGTIWQLEADDIDRMLAINVRAPLLAMRYAAEIMRREGVEGSIVNVGSTNAHGGQPVLLAYNASKGALATATKSTAYGLIRHRIKVNQVNPGWMDTESEDATQRRWHDAPDDWLARAEAGQPLGRLLKPPEVAKVIAFYLSPASGIMTGNVVDYDQGVIGAGDVPKPTAADTP